MGQRSSEVHEIKLEAAIHVGFMDSGLDVEQERTIAYLLARIRGVAAVAETPLGLLLKLSSPQYYFSVYTEVSRTVESMSLLRSGEFKVL